MVVSASIGIIFFSLAGAATPYVSLEAETGLISGSAIRVTDSSGSGGQAIKFGPSTIPSGKPDANNTGVPVGTVLTLVEGNTTISQPGVYDANDYRGFVTVTASNVTLTRSKFNGGTLPVVACDPAKSGSGATGALVISSNATNVVIEDSDIIIANPHKLIDGLRGSNFTLRRSEVSRGVDGIGIYGVGNVVVENSYIHDLYWFAESQYHQCTPSHNDSIQLHNGVNVRFSSNTIIGKTFNNANANAAIQVNQNGGQTTGNLTIDGNWMNYGGCTLNISENQLAAINNLKVTNNKFGRNASVLISGEPCAIIVSTITKAYAGTVINGNVWEDGSLPVPTIRTGR